MDIIPICEREHQKLVSGVCPWCHRTIRNGAIVPEDIPRYSSRKRSRRQPQNLQEMQRHLHSVLMERLDLSRVTDLNSTMLRQELRLVVERLCDCDYPLLAGSEREQVIDGVLNML
jgi:pilus assembly protein CpaF